MQKGDVNSTLCARNTLTVYAITTVSLYVNNEMKWTQRTSKDSEEKSVTESFYTSVDMTENNSIYKHGQS